jgi:hypothetical protein
VERLARRTAERCSIAITTSSNGGTLKPVKWGKAKGRIAAEVPETASGCALRSGLDLAVEMAAQVGAGAVDVLPQPLAGEVDVARYRALCDLAVLHADVPIA